MKQATFPAHAGLLVLGVLMAACSHPAPVSKPAAKDPAMTIVTKTLPKGMRGVGYYEEIQVWHAHQPLSFSIPVGQLCDGLKLDPIHGSIKGIPPKAGTCGFALQVTDSQGAVAQQNLEIEVIDGALPRQ